MSRNRDLAVLLALAALRLALHCATNGQYGFHRDELAVLDDARYLAWGYVAYPPLTPFVARIALELFGASLVGVRFFSALAQSVAMVFAGLMARELGGSRAAQVLAAVATAIAPMALIMGALFQYIAFDYLWWVLAAYFVLRVSNNDDPRGWLWIGAAFGLGMLTKYTMVFWVAGIVTGMLLTPLRRHLRGPWPWIGAALSLLIFLPNLLWQMQADFVSLEFLRHIHARDVAIGRADGFFSQQLFVSASPFTLPLWVAGLYHLFTAAGGRYRALAIAWVVALLSIGAARGRFYYMAPAYPVLFAAGAVAWTGMLERMRPGSALAGRIATWTALALGAAVGGLLMLPIAPPGSAAFTTVAGVHDNFVEQIGWPEITATVAEIHAALPPEDRAQAGILAGNYGEAGAINLHGPAHGLPRAISGINSYWRRGYGDPPPRVLIVLGFDRDDVDRMFASCEIAGRVSNPFGVENEESRFHPDIFVCREPRLPWDELWPRLRSFG